MKSSLKYCNLLREHNEQFANATWKTCVNLFLCLLGFAMQSFCWSFFSSRSTARQSEFSFPKQAAPNTRPSAAGPCWAWHRCQVGALYRWCNIAFRLSVQHFSQTISSGVLVFGCLITISNWPEHLLALFLSPSNGNHSVFQALKTPSSLWSMGAEKPIFF